jgi:hypothetical protein
LKYWKPPLLQFHLMDNQLSTQSFIGLYSLEPNPCLTHPCLPGMVPAVKTGIIIRFLLIDGHFLPDDFVFGEYAPKQGERVEIIGTLKTMTDIFGEAFDAIETTSCLPS